LAWGVLAVLVLVVLLLVAGGWWASRTTQGADWVLRQVPGLALSGQRGSLHGGPFEAARAEFTAGGRRITVQGLSWRDLRWHWRPPGGAWVGLTVIEPRARRVVVGPAPPISEPAREPASLRLPVQLRAESLAIERLELAGAGAPLTDVTAAEVELGADAGALHRIVQLRAEHDRVSATLDAQIASDAPFAVQAQAQLAARAETSGTTPPWQATLRASGPLARPAVQASLLGGTQQQARLDAQATLAPFAPWPIAALAASTQDLDLSALASGWPQTRLTGRADIDSRGLDQPLRADLRLRNDAPGRWDEARLPVEMLHAALQGRADQRDTVAFELLALRLAGGGSASGAGRWQGPRLELTIEFDGLDTRALDARAPQLRLRGPVEVALTGLPAPDGSVAAAPTFGASGSARLDGQQGRHRATLAAKFDAERDADAWRLTLDEARLQSGDARAEGRVSAERAHADGAWRVQSRGALARFDPAVWWPAFGRGQAHALNGRWVIDLAGPAPAARADALALLRAARGEAALTLAPSRLAGVAASGEAKLTAGRDAALAARLDAAGNALQLDARLGRAPERWQGRVRAPALQALAPLGSLHPALARWWPRTGALDAEFDAQGRWPALVTRGQAQARGIAAAEWRAERADLRWQLDTAGAPDAPLQLMLDAAGLAQRERRLDTLVAQIDGSLRAHRVTLDAASAALRPPAWVAQVQPGATGSSGTRLRLRGDGGWLAARGGGGRWQGRIAELLLRERGGADAAPAWVDARDLAAALQFDAGGALRELRADPARITLLGAALRWRELAWQPGTRLALDAELEPLAAAPWLAKLQPEWGWGGDLTLAGRFTARQSAADGFNADFVLERRAGDLHLTDDLGLTQALGLTDLRLGLVAQGGTWHFTQAVAGANLGVLAGAQTVRIARDALWPPAGSALQGVLEWRVENLGVWAPFAPPGWRLGGRLHTSAAIGGRFGAPEYTGRMVGSALAARNLLEGIDIRDGELAVSLRGADARIEQARFRGGDGELRLTGGASFGEQPAAQLQLVAERFQLLGRFDRRIVASGSAELALTREQLRADGRFTVDEGLIDFSRADAPRLDSDVVVIRRPAGAPAPVPDASAVTAAAARPAAARSGPLAQAQVRIEVDLGDKLRVRGRGLDSRLAGRLTVTTPGGRLAVDGSVRAEDGTYAAYGQRLEIERGVLRFAGDVATPRLDIVATRPNLDVRVGVVVSGTAAAPRVRLFSEPEMSDLDKLSWLVLGRAPDGLGRTDTALLQRAALALLAGEGPGPTDAVLARLGIDELSVRQTENGEVRDTVITIGRQLSRRWYLGYERGVNATTGTWQLIYRIAQRFTLRAQSGNENALDLVWTWKWDEPRQREPRMRGERPPPP
jgi:translocation and assembly module TamB